MLNNEISENNMSGTSAHSTEGKRTKLANKDVVVGKGIIKAVENDCEFGYIYALPGGLTTRSKERATRCAALINFFIVNYKTA